MSPGDPDHPFYGRKQEIEYLQQVFGAILKSNYSSDSKRCLDGSSTVVTESTSPTVSTSSTKDDGICICNCKTKDGASDQGREICNSGRFILISGPNGAGKRSLAFEALNQYRTLKKCCRNSNFLQVSGQFRLCQGVERENTTNPYTNGRSREFEHSFLAFHDAMRELIDYLSQDIEMISSTLSHLKLLLKEPKDAVILAQTFPSVKKIVRQDSLYDVVDDETPEVYCRVHLLGMPSAEERLQVLCRAVVSFFKAVSSCVPLVLVLEDLQYADTESIMLIDMLLNSKDNDVKNDLIIMATYTKDTVETMSETIEAFLQPNTDDSKEENRLPVGLYRNTKHQYIHHVCLSCLSWDDVLEWTLNSDEMTSSLSTDQKREFADLVFHHTNGNPCHIHYLFQFLQNDSTLLSHPIHKKWIPSTVAALYSSILIRQDDAVVNLVRCAAALSHHSETDVIDCDILRIAMQKPCVDEVLQAQECGLLDFFPARGYIRFRRKDFQKAVYDTVPDLAILHFDIGRSIWSDAILMHDQEKTTEAEMKRIVLRAMLHLRESVDVMLDFEDRMQMSKFCYEYGLRSSEIGDFFTAAKLFEFAIRLFGPELWRPDLYETCLALHNAAAQTYFYICDTDRTEQTLDAIFSYARRFEDKLSAYIVLVYAKSKGQMKDAFRILVFVLGELGVPIDSILNPSALVMFLNAIRMRRFVLRKSDAFLSNLPVASEDSLIIAHFLSFAMFFIFIVQPKTSFLLCSRLMCFSVKNGITGPAAVAFAQYGSSQCMFGKFEKGYRFGRLALQFADRFEVWRPRIFMYIYGLTHFWFHPFRSLLEPLCQAQIDAIKYGDLQVYGALSAFVFPVLFLVSSPLDVLKVDARSCCQSLSDVGQINPIIFVLPIFFVINDLTGVQDTMDIAGEIQDADRAFNYAVKEGVVSVPFYFYGYHTILNYLLGNYDKSLEMAEKANKTLVVSIFSVHVMFYEGISTSGKAWAFKSSQKRWTCIRRCQKIAHQLKKYADRCPENVRNKQLLLDAEIAALSGKSSLALSLYEASIARAEKEDFLHESGVAYERLGIYQIHLGNNSDGTMSLELACKAFKNWGAQAVVDRIDRLIASIQP